jgi:hypothetical protein
MTVRKKRRGLVGLYFLTGPVPGWQGYVLDEDENRIIVLLFEWLMGDPNTIHVVPQSEAFGWTFFDDSEHFQSVAQRIAERGYPKPRSTGETKTREAPPKWERIDFTKDEKSGGDE